MLSRVFLAALFVTLTPGSALASSPPGPIDGPATITTEAPEPEACLQHRTGGPDLDVYTTYPSLLDDGVTGSTRWGITPCGPPLEPVVAASAPAPRLPATGAHHLPLTLGALALALGVTLTRLAARS